MPADAAAYRPFFFHTRDFILRNGESPDTYTLQVYADGEVYVRIHVALVGTEAISLPKSSFGGFDLHPEASADDIRFALDALSQFCRGKHIFSIRLIMYPDCYDSFSAGLIHEALQLRNARALYTDETQYLPIGREPFDASIRPDERRHLNHARKQDWRFWQEPSEMLSDAYELIRLSREMKGYPVTMTLNDLIRSFSMFPDHYFLFSIRNASGEMLAACVAIHVNEHVLYDFYHGDNPEARKHSPVVPLIEGLFSYARTHGYGVLDLGTSTENGVRNENLFDFKKHLGAEISAKVTYEISTRGI